MPERVLLYRRIRANHGSPRRPVFTYFQRWEGDEPNGWAWWIEQRSKAFRFGDLGEARKHLAKLREHVPRQWTAGAPRLRIVRVMGLR